MQPTIYDIAREASVSIATVSRVLNNHARVSQKTRAKVMAVARRLNYHPHVSARNLASRHSNLVLAVIPMLTNYFYMEVVRGVQDALADSELDLLVYSARAPEYVDVQLSRALQRGRAEGILLFSTPLTTNRVELMKHAEQPVVLVDSYHDAFDSVSVDNTRGGYMATSHLVSLGYRSIGLITGHPTSVPAVDRKRGYIQALDEAGLSFNEAWTVVSDQTHQHGYTEHTGYEAMKYLLGLDQRPDAVFIASDTQALGALQALRETRLAVPGDMAIVGFDDIQVSTYVGLTTLAQPMYEMGKQAINRLLQRMEEPEQAVSHTAFSPRLVIRETCGASQVTTQTTRI